jgi:hypothetical protein
MHERNITLPDLVCGASLRQQRLLWRSSTAGGSLLRHIDVLKTPNDPPNDGVVEIRFPRDSRGSKQVQQDDRIDPRRMIEDDEPLQRTNLIRKEIHNRMRSWSLHSSENHNCSTVVALVIEPLEIVFLWEADP